MTNSFQLPAALKIHLVAAVLILSLFAPSAFAAKDCETPLADNMEDLKTAMGEYVRANKQGDWDEMAMQRELMVTLVEKSALLIPKKTDSLPKAEQQAFINEYQQGMKKMDDYLMKLGVAENSKDQMQGSKVLDDIKGFNRSSHRKFKSCK